MERQPLPTVSIVTPSFNQGGFLGETIRSVIGQGEDVHEYLVLDGGSSDDSVGVIGRYEWGIDYWRSEKDGGQSDAIDRGFRRCTGEFLLWLNSDDVLLPGAVRRVREALAARPEWDVLTGWHVRVDSATRVRSAWRIPGESAAAARRGVHHVCQPTCFFRRSLYERVGGLDLGLHCMMDTELWYRFFDAGARWGHVPAYLAAFRVHESSKGSSWGARYAEEAARVGRRYARYHAPTVGHRLGLAGYRAGQLLSGRHFGARRDTRAWSGRHIKEVFGDWELPALRDGTADRSSPPRAPASAG